MGILPRKEYDMKKLMARYTFNEITLSEAYGLAERGYDVVVNDNHTVSIFG